MLRVIWLRRHYASLSIHSSFHFIMALKQLNDGRKAKLGIRVRD
jgi:hypothetical protein